MLSLYTSASGEFNASGPTAGVTENPLTGLFYGGGSRLDTSDGKDLRLIRLKQEFFTSNHAWPYDWQGRSCVVTPKNCEETP